MPVARLSWLFSLRFQTAVVLMLCMASGLSHAQPDPDPIATHPTVSPAVSGPGLHRGTNEFGFWTGYSPFSFVLKGTVKDRQLFLLNLQYARTLIARAPVTLKYTAEIVPVAFEVQPTQKYLVDGKVLTNPAGTIYGAGATPIGLQANVGRRKIQPFASGTLGFLYFRQQVPVLESSQFNYTISIGFGTQFFPRSGRSFTVGWKYFHLSNHDQGHLNPGLDSGVFYVGFSAFRARRKVSD